MASTTAAPGDMSADLTRLLQQLQKSVLDDRKDGGGSLGGSVSAAGKKHQPLDASEAAGSDEYPSDIDEEEVEEDEQEDEVIFEEGELQDMMKEAAKVHVSRWTTGLGGALGATLGASGSLGGSRGGGSAARQMSLGLPAGLPRQLSKAHSATKEMLGAPTLVKQLEGVFTELDAISSAEPPTAAIPSSPQDASPRRRVTLFGSSKSGEKKRLIAKLQAQMQVLEGDRKGLAERVRKAGQTGGVALAMLKEEVNALQAQVQAKAKELEEAQDAEARHEAEALQLRTTMSGLRKQLDELKARPPLVVSAPAPAPAPAAPSLLQHLPSPVPASQQQQQQQEQQQQEQQQALVVAGAAAAEAEARVVQLESELDLAYGKIEALSLQQHTSMDRGTALVQQLQAELREARAQLAARVKKYAELKEKVRQLEEELEAAAGANEALKHGQDLRVAKIEERLKEAMREALENERTAKSALFKREQAEAEAERLREAYDVLVGQFEAIKSQVELEKLEAQGIVTRYERELEDVYGKLNAKDEYAGLLCGVKKDMDVELSDLWARLEAAEEGKQKVEQAFLALGAKHRAASARRIFNFMVGQSKRMKREALRHWRETAKAGWSSDEEEEEDSEEEED